MAAADTLPKLCLPKSPYRIGEKVRNGSPLTESSPLRLYRIPKVNTNRSVTWVDWSKVRAHPETFGMEKFLPETLEPLLRIAPWSLNTTSQS
ncbi:hypothetical protein TorRG33x02_047940 [Trema orientale]|uniref:Uncharacterized protein n=1 Tax=Trema orientale TaxID=63057 RepID=A0A2P5FN67_TREOI|nr:hypothetical protein TorRG33x02_047940 [Trema orientale]